MSQTATHPALLDAFTLAIVADGDWMPAYPGFIRPPMDIAKARERARGIGMAAAELRKIAPHSGSYFCRFCRKPDVCECRRVQGPPARMLAESAIW